MAKINFTCPLCKAIATLEERCDYNVTIDHPIESLRLIPGSEPSSPLNVETRFKTDPKTNDIIESEVGRDFVEIRSFLCSDCGEDLCDDDGNLISDQDHLAAWLDEKGMLVREENEPKGDFDSGHDQDDTTPPEMR